MTNSDGVKCDEARCDCGHLVAKLRTSGVELKCKRCKRLVIIPYSAEDQQHLKGRPLSHLSM